MTKLVETMFVAAALMASTQAVPRVLAQQQAPQAEPLRIVPTDSLFDRYTVEPKWGQLPSSQPWGGVTTGVAVDGKGTVVVLVRTAPYFRVFTRDGRFVKAWGDAGAFGQPHSVHFGPDGGIWASDPNRHVVYKFSPEGKLLMTLGKSGVRGDNSSREAFTRPAGLTVARNGDVFVADGYVNSRIVHFDKNGTLVKIVGGKKGSGAGELSLPHAVAIDSKGQILVGDSDNKRIVVFNSEGGFVTSFPGPSRGGLVITPDDTLYASDVNAGVVTVFRNNQIADVIRVGTRPHGLDVDPATGDVYVASTTPDAPGVTKASPRHEH
jgi:DNA-binding beta-propeller fold protein YncE